MPQSSEPPMPQYLCHKKVWALKIAGVSHPAPTAADAEPDGSMILSFSDKRFADRRVSHVYVLKHLPSPGGYFVVYEGGYESFSPADAFESGYTLVD